MAAVEITDIPSPRTPTTSPPKLSSPSPSKLTRKQEKQELQHLNDRLAAYIERVIRLEETNKKLTQELTISKTTVEKDVSNIKSMYENELTEAKRLLDETARDKAKHQIECSKITEERDALKAKLASESNAKARLEEEIAHLQRKLSEKEAQLLNVNTEARKLADQVDELAAECREAKEALQKAKYSLEQETLTRVDFENQAQSLREDLYFKKQVYNEEVGEIRSQLRMVETRSVTMESEFKSKFEGVLQEKLAELRMDYEEKTRQQKADTEAMLSSKYAELKDRSDKDATVISSLRENYRQVSSQFSSLKAENGMLLSQISALENRLKELEDAKAMDETDAASAIAELNAEIKMLRKKLEDSAVEYEDLLGVKTAVQMELDAYRKLLEGEEERLDITPPDSPVYGPSPLSRRRKRARVEETVIVSTPKSIGSVQIQEVDKEGKFIRLYNASEQDQAMGGWTLTRKVDDGTSHSYKFTPKYVLKANTSVVVWSSEGGGQHKPPGDLVAKQVPSWGTGEKTTTLLINPDGQELASFVEELKTTFRDSTDSRAVYAAHSVKPGDRCVIS